MVVEYSVNITVACRVTDVANILTHYFSSFFRRDPMQRQELYLLKHMATRQYDRPENPICSQRLLQDNLKVWERGQIIIQREQIPPIIPLSGFSDSVWECLCTNVKTHVITADVHKILNRNPQNRNCSAMS